MYRWRTCARHGGKSRGKGIGIGKAGEREAERRGRRTIQTEGNRAERARDDWEREGGTGRAGWNAGDVRFASRLEFLSYSLFHGSFGGFQTTKFTFGTYSRGGCSSRILSSSKRISRTAGNLS